MSLIEGTTLDDVEPSDDELKEIEADGDLFGTTIDDLFSDPEWDFDEPVGYGDDEYPYESEKDWY